MKERYVFGALTRISDLATVPPSARCSKPNGPTVTTSWAKSSLRAAAQTESN